MDEKLTLFRGIAVLSKMADRAKENILQTGIRGNEGGQWRLTLNDLRQSLETLLEKPNLSLADTRPSENRNTYAPAVCACGDTLGASYYAIRHNRNKDLDERSLLIQLSVQASRVYVDGRDFLYPCFQLWDRASGSFAAIQRRALTKLFGNRIGAYFDKAVASNDSQHRIALCDLACQDPQIVKNHAESRITVRGRYGVVFSSAFLVTAPILASEIVGVDVATEQDFQPHLTLDDFLKGHIPSGI
jgi:hypothetical protein